MERSEFLKSVLFTTLSLSFMKLQAFEKTISSLKPSPKMPLLFVGHGNPMNAILDNSFNRKWKEMGKTLPQPQAILVVSAHWITPKATKVTAMEFPKTIHDFGGFPKELFAQEYPAPGAISSAEETIEIVKSVHVEKDFEWGLDHGTWSILKPMFPDATIPVYQISIDYNKPAQFHFELGKELTALRNNGVLIIGSGNIVHNLGALQQNGIVSWAQEFDQKIKTFIDDKDFQSVVDFQKLGSLAKQAHPSYDHFLPLLHVLGATTKKDSITYFNDSFDLGSISMRSLLIADE